ncbi:SMI1/KNR4 family protein, partial [Pseudomonas aeruginosa]|nr:SMI1/KNR4 family protein [Pseudomonas aeruginosa]
PIPGPPAFQTGAAAAAGILGRPVLVLARGWASAVRGALASRAERERSDARRVRSGKMGSNRSPDDYLALAERLERFLAELPG